ncbi:4-hydroxy-3-methylbut-2-en-1-yl diphosphate synthase (flavodoxin) [Frankliniella fusca]|uniref:4-hydroxy-3-methylbut-2-en-1-yl diphosphate synthase (Flavodoxin) n=1 Tax=Frankliniella fusca TaxID=407009 RepID=A0AAE1HAK4_9NEOP|nr:4-hydroxy-3-methylbut-2-en-1-yl diphosphate synthase (flavodoxin) [Frankliniella fusca]KAK3917867.1 4-hydroxy-3-methylbut-2-en-1-yl diphosphate synthase (flavodoxin) [Frankliniella fusca]KAK3921424.1 4-hydroxy-3-methylbut-2-en-1-yl diphosphate synthase (flavodoxin) [Frankliniella fusca]KAK3921631.1 4-hydroxy-3-methylbut-2-en-1-yl diphosphate synthase (flavodoxin) [Frankliniella fusca]KAK3923349.1 4-hydroxy-3-methylbut-2-en-1-yl diphosphate synthase (flavodoxin) [Frankliniella fusca]
MQEGAGIREGTSFWRGPDLYDYHVHSTMSGGRISLRCTQHYLEKCPGRASVCRDGTYFRTTQRHNHDKDKYKIEERLFRRALMRRCRRGDHTPFRIMFNQERRSLRISRQAAARIPLVKLRSSMRRARLENRPQIPRSLKAFDKILRLRRYRALSRTLDGRDIIYAGRAGKASERTISLVFVTRRMVKYMKRVQKIFCDGTFSPVPRGIKASQVWTVSTLRRHHVIPLFRVLMRKRTTAAYRAALEKIKAIAPRFNPSEIMSDYEGAEQRALQEAFPHAKCRGCLFHYAKVHNQTEMPHLKGVLMGYMSNFRPFRRVPRHLNKAVGGQARKIGMTKLIKKHKVIQRLVRWLCALPLLPRKLIWKGFKVIGKEARNHGVMAKMIKLFTYWCKQWKPKISVLSVCNSTDRTSNCCESENRMFQDAVSQRRPNVWDFLDGVLEIEDRTQQDIVTLNWSRSNPSRIRATTAVSNDDVVKGLTTDLLERTISVKLFLRQVSYSISRAMQRGIDGRKNRRRIDG